MVAPRNSLDYVHGVCVGADYTDEEREFLVAVDRYKRRARRPHPTWREVLAVLHALGYRKVAVETDVPVVGTGRGHNPHAPETDQSPTAHSL